MAVIPNKKLTACHYGALLPLANYCHRIDEGYAMKFRIYDPIELGVYRYIVIQIPALACLLHQISNSGRIRERKDCALTDNDDSFHPWLDRADHRSDILDGNTSPIECKLPPSRQNDRVDIVTLNHVQRTTIELLAMAGVPAIKCENGWTSGCCVLEHRTRKRTGIVHKTRGVMCRKRVSPQQRHTIVTLRQKTLAVLPLIC